jgi:hypothetical protein
MADKHTDNSTVDISLVRPGKLGDVLDCSRTTAWRIAQESDFPKLVTISFGVGETRGSISGYKRSELAAFIERRSAQ